MDKVIYLNSHCKNDFCSGSVYHNFIDYAFERTNHFMLVYVNYYGKGYSSQMKEIKKKLSPFKIKSRSNPSWPGTLDTFTPNTSYKIIFYRNCLETKEILKSVSSLYSWTRPLYPQDLAFFKGNRCWFYSVGHEKISAILHANEEDLSFLKLNSLANINQAYTPKDHYFDNYDEIF